jgi:hypothetical protein
MKTQKLTLEWIGGEDHVMLLLPADVWNAAETAAAQSGEKPGVLLGRKVAESLGASKGFVFEIMRSEEHAGVLIRAPLYAVLETHAERMETSTQYVVSRCVVELVGSIVYDRRIEGDIGSA